MRQIFVDSRDRSSGTSTNFSMALPQTLSLHSGHQGRIDDLRLPNAIPMISVANNKIDVLMNGRYDYLTLTNGQCNTGDQLADRIRTKLLEVAGGLKRHVLRLGDDPRNHMQQQFHLHSRDVHATVAEPPLLSSE